MKITKIVLLVISGLCMIFQIVGYAGRIKAGQRMFEHNNIWYLIGFNSMAIFSIIFFLVAIWLQRKIKKRKELSQVYSFLRDRDQL